MDPMVPGVSEERKRMVLEQLVPRGISDPAVLRAFRTVNRHHYVPGSMRLESYADRPLPIGRGQTISQPYMAALMTQCLGLKGPERVLEIGTGSGYQAAILAEICKEVYTIERDVELSGTARIALSGDGYENIRFACGDGTRGWKEHAPFNGIIVTAGSPGVPSRLREQLDDGGRMVIPVGDMYSQTLKVVTRQGEGFVEDDVCGCIFVPLIGEEGWGPKG